MDTQMNVPPPGEFIREELEARGWTQRDLAYVLGIDDAALNKIIAGRSGISADMAKKLAAAFDVSPELFINLQSAYELARAPSPDPAVAGKARLQSAFPVREMIRRGWLVAGESVNLLQAQLERLLEVPEGANSETLEEPAFAAKRTRYDGEITPAQRVWVHRVRQLGREMTVPRYSERGLKKSLDLLRSLLIAPEEGRHVSRVLCESGVRFVVVEGLSSEKIDGVCTWLDDKSPVVGLSMRRDRIDNFWFVLRHELEHVLRGDGRDLIRIDTALVEEGTEACADLPPGEKEANEAATDFCIPRRELESFIARKAPYISERDVLGFAARLQIHPGIVAGQVRNHLKRWNVFAKHLVKIREQVVSTAVVDGWGTNVPLVH
jgi:HTH-type transcriptional regulator/antitoxin HigA